MLTTPAGWYGYRCQTAIGKGYLQSESGLPLIVKLCIGKSSSRVCPSTAGCSSPSMSCALVSTLRIITYFVKGEGRLFSSAFNLSRLIRLSLSEGDRKGSTYNLKVDYLS